MHELELDDISEEEVPRVRAAALSKNLRQAFINKS
jgi:hypothetical protein